MVRRSRTAFSADDPTTTVTLPASAGPTPSTFEDGGPVPKLIVFDLDYTLWPFWCDTHVDPPVKANPKDGGLTIRDAHGATHGFYNEVAGLLAAIREKGILVGCASRTCTPDLARKMLTLLRLPSGGETSSGQSKPAISAFEYLEMYPGSKTTHFQRIKKRSGVQYEEMLFFDDESRNRDVEELGVVMQLVRDGVTVKEVDGGVRRWRERNKKFLAEKEDVKKEEAKTREG
jgi:magnesium-dependent phosphatase 1